MNNDTTDNLISIDNCVISGFEGYLDMQNSGIYYHKSGCSTL